jgi:nucleoside-diphosphate-sugar epimerase
VRALVRSPQQADALAAQGVELVEGDLGNASALQQLVAGSDAVVHAAGAVRGSSRADFDLINVDGTATLLAAIKSQTNPPRLLMLSSLAAREPQLSWYAGSKSAAEALLSAAPDLDWVILRPPAVYGPGDKEMLPIFQLMARGLAFVPGSLDARISLIHVADLVSAIIACLNCAGTSHQTLTLCDGKAGGYDWQELAGMAGTTWTRRVRIFRVPRWLLDGIARINISLARLSGRAPMLTPPKLRELRHTDWVVDNREINARTGWEPLISLHEGLEEIRKAEL